MAGLFGEDFGGFGGGGIGEGGFDMDKLFQWLNPMGTAQAAGMGPNGAPQGGLTPEALANSAPAQMPMAGFPPEITGSPSNPRSVGSTSFAPTEPPPTFSGQYQPNAPDARTAMAAEELRARRDPSFVHGGGRSEAITTNPKLEARMAARGGSPAEVGAALNGEPAPLPQGPTPSGATLDEASQGAMAQAPGGRPSLAQALKGVTAPAAPVQQKISSPNAPRPTGTIKGGELMALMAAINAGGGGKPPRLGG